MNTVDTDFEVTMCACRFAGAANNGNFLSLLNSLSNGDK